MNTSPIPRAPKNTPKNNLENTVKNTLEIAVVGAGIIGSMIAVSLQDQGHRVHLLEANYPGQATRASGGMLAAGHEEFSGIWQDYASQSLERWKTWRIRLGELGFDLSYVPQITSENCTYLEDGSLDPVQVLAALRQLCPPTFAECQHFFEDANGVRLEGENIPPSIPSNIPPKVDLVILATGAWSGKFGLQVQPYQGQSLLLERRWQGCAHYAHGGYVIPRGDKCYVGATTQAGERSTLPNPTALAFLQDLAHKHGIPRGTGAKRDFPLEHLVGLRPFAPTPIVGFFPNSKRVLVATGHYRNGILLAPITAHLIGEMVSEMISEFTAQKAPAL